MNYHYVYGLVEGKSLVYVGYTSQLKRRKSRHLRKNPNRSLVVLAAYSSAEEGYAAEVWWIARLRAKGHTLENISLGGAGGPPRSRSDSFKQKMSATLMGHSISSETRAKISRALKGRSLSPEVVARMSAAQKGRYISPEWRTKISSALMGRSLSSETRAKISRTLTGSTWSPARRAAHENKSK